MKKRILVVDDERDICVMMKDLLEAEGFEVETCFDGKECLEKAQRDGYALILLDIFMPDLSGEDVLRLLREKGFKIPIVFVSIKPKHEVDLAKANGFVQKPFKNQDLISVVQKTIEV